MADVDDSEVIAVDNEAEPISAEESEIVAVENDAEPVSVAEEADVVSAGSTFGGSNSTFDISSLLNGTTISFSNGTTMNISDLLNGTTISFGNGTGISLGNTTFSFGNGTTLNFTNGTTFSLGNGTTFSFGNSTFSFGNGTGNGTNFDINSIMNMLGGNTQETIEAVDINKYYSKTTTFKVTVKKGNETLSTGSVIFTINNKQYVGHIGSDGVASVSLKTLKPGTYYIFSEYGQTVVKNTITIKKSIITKNVSKKYKKAGKFTVKILNTKGKPYAKQTVKVKFKGKTYSIKTNSKGIATLKLAKNLKVGKYTVKTTYAGMTVSNKITVKK